MSSGRSVDRDFLKRMVEMDESMREIASLDELYNELVSTGSKDERELSVRKEEAMFARERMLKLSLHVKNLIAGMESEETLK
jgi:hypothetical protein